jgi:oxygen-independent coproporphyrinogen-3 oxidase
MGVQDFDAGVLEKVRRTQDGLMVGTVVEHLRSRGVGEINFDLIYGLPGQTLDRWLKTLERAVSFHPEHISCYQLTATENTKLWEMLERGEVKLPDDSEGETFFLATAEYLEDHQYLHYEISNFSRGRENRSRHNQKYWQHTPYLGLGPSAHSFQDGKRWWNVRSVEHYCCAINEGRVPVGGEETLTREQRELESLYLGLRTSGGVTLEQVTANRGYKTLLSELVQGDYVKVIDQKVVPTRKGFLVSDRLPLAFM